MIVKNEHKRILASLESVRGIVESFIILDTGSTDDTIEIIKSYCNTHDIVLHLIRQEFAQPFNYSTARNVVLDFADDKADYLLLLDCNDELRNGPELLRFTRGYCGVAVAFHICQEWWNGTALDKYYNIRLVRSGHSWRYRGSIHEYISCIDPQIPQTDTVSRVCGFSLYQDRTLDDDTSFKRFSRDENILDAEYSENRRLKIIDPRNVFYYGQTCMCLGKTEKAYLLYKERGEMTVGFFEERYHALYRCGELARSLKHDWETVLLWYIRAYEFSSTSFDHARAEPLYRIAEHYRDKNWELSYLYLKRCIDLKYPESAILFVDKRVYSYLRYNLMGIVGFYAGELECGKSSVMIAIEVENKLEDRNNLLHYSLPSPVVAPQSLPIINSGRDIIQSHSVKLKEKLKEKLKTIQDQRRKK